MKFYYSAFFAAALTSQSPAQSPLPPTGLMTVADEKVVEVVPPREATTETTVTETVTPGVPVRRLDPALVRRQLGVAPRALPVPVPAPGTKVEVTETTVTKEVPGQPPRVYNYERSVVIVEGRELPYITIPVLFVKETAELLDAESRLAVEDTAGAILEIIKSDPNARFDIEGHTSTDGTAELNLDLSAQRARRVFEELTQRYAVPVTALSAHGHGESYPSYPAGTEAEMTLDRRVLVVRIK